MKKTILVVLMVSLVATTCFAGEVETDGFFSIEDTRWSVYTMRFGILFPIPVFLIGPVNYTVGFHQGKVYRCFEEDECEVHPDYSYIDSPVVSIVTFSAFSFPVIGSWGVGLGILQSSGLGVYTEFTCILEYLVIGFVSNIDIMFKIEDNWTPPDAE